MARLRTALLATLVALLTFTLAPSASAYQGGAVDDPANPNPVTTTELGRRYLLTTDWDSSAELDQRHGYHLDRVVTGDWDGDGDDVLTSRWGRLYYVPGGTVEYGRRSDEVLVGDWDGDGKDTLTIRRGRGYHVKNDLSSGAADRYFEFGRENDVVLVGDWDGDGKDTLAVRRGREYHVNNTLSSGVTSLAFEYGREGDLVMAGDWDGDGDDTLSVRRGAVFHINNSLTSGSADFALTYGVASDGVVVGDWDGDGDDNVGLRRREIALPSAGSNQSIQVAHRYGVRLSGTDTHEEAASSTIGLQSPYWDYVWVRGTHAREHGWNSERVKAVVYHEVGHVYQTRACGTPGAMPRREHIADAIAFRLHGWDAPTLALGGYAYTAADMADAREILAGQCPVD